MVLLKSNPLIYYEQISLIMEQLNKCICKVYSNNGSFSSGFFCLIPYNNKKLPVLIVNNHLINEQFIKSQETISFELNKEYKKINIKDNRIFYTNIEDDITIIEINPDKDFIFNFLELDENIFKEKEIFYGESICIINCEKRVSFGILHKILGNNEHTKIFYPCSTEESSCGSPIINLSNGKIIGIHIRGDTKCKYNKYNIGTFLKYPVEDLIDKFKDYINSKEKIISKIYSIANYSKNETQILDFDNKNKILENELKLEKEKNMILQDKILQLQKLLDSKEIKKGNIGKRKKK